MHGDVCLGLSDNVWCQIMIDFLMSCNLSAARRIQREWDPRPPADKAHGLQIGSGRGPFAWQFFCTGTQSLFYMGFDVCTLTYLILQMHAVGIRATISRILFVFAQ